MCDSETTTENIILFKRIHRSAVQFDNRANQNVILVSSVNMHAAAYVHNINIIITLSPAQIPFVPFLKRYHNTHYIIIYTFICVHVPTGP